MRRDAEASKLTQYPSLRLNRDDVIHTAMRRTFRLPIGFFLALGLVVVATGWLSCSKNSSTSPTQTTTSITGLVTDAVSGAAVASVTVAIQGKSATTGSDGRYSISALTDGQATLTAQHQGHRNFTQAVTLSGATTTNITITPAVEAGAAGNWAGTWRNNTFGSSGGITAVVTVDTIAQTFRGTVDVNGSVFGAGDPPAETFSGPYTTAGVTLTGTSPFFGNVVLNISSTGAITGNMTNIPGGSVSRLDLTGNATSASSITLAYTVVVGGGTASGTVTLNRQ